MSPSTISLLFCLLALLYFAPFTADAAVPSSSTFKYVNDGEFGPYVVEYGGDYRVLPLASSPFQLCFYNTTPNAFTLALRMGTVRSESQLRWVWEANRGNPVRENATLTFGRDGNLVLADADGRIAWQTNTANKGVTGFRVLPNGNIVVHDSRGKFIWQSFDHPTDTLFVGQSLRVGGPTRLVSRASVKDNSNGPYSFVLEANRLALYYTSPNSRKPLLYFTNSLWSVSGTLTNVTLSSSPDTDEAHAFEIALGLGTNGNVILGRPKYNATLSILRIDVDGNLRVYTFNDKVDYRAWEVTFELFSQDSVWDTSGCQLPERCGKFGLCEDNQCVACPSPKGLLGWSKECDAKRVSSCAPRSVRYYKLEGVDNFVSNYNAGEGPVKERDCGNKCTRDCKCLGYFYHRQTSKCWIAHELKTLEKVQNSTHLAYIKI